MNCEFKSQIINQSFIFSIIHDPRTFLKDWDLGNFKPPKMGNYSTPLTPSRWRDVSRHFGKAEGEVLPQVLELRDGDPNIGDYTTRDLVGGGQH